MILVFRGRIGDSFAKFSLQLSGWHGWFCLENIWSEYLTVTIGKQYA